MRIRIRNFMTYTDTELRPGPNLNIILGPNGTGKSAIVCCIIIGLAGEVTLTGRGASPADFVKKNQNSASTEIELYNDRGKNFVIERQITITGRNRFKSDHSSEWKINGKKVLKNAVKELTQQLNIKVDNLCQFLPQDSVTQFVKMNSIELLTNTLKAAGDNQLVEDHTRLINYTKEVEEKRDLLVSLERSRKENEINAKRLESEVVQLRQREGLVKEKNLVIQKMHYLQYLDALAQRNTFKEHCQKTEADLKKAEKSSEPCKKAVEARKKAESEAQRSLQDSADKVSLAKRTVGNLENKLESLKSECQEKFHIFKAKQDQESQRATTIRDKRQEIDTLESKFEEIRDIDCSRQLASLEAEMAKFREMRKNNLHSKRDNDNLLKNQILSLDRLQREKDQILKIKDKKLQFLQSRNRDALIGTEWLTKNRHRFAKHVYPPMMCEIDVKDVSNCGIIENAIPRNELMSFVCQTKEDLQSFTRAARDELKIKISVVLAPTKTMEQFSQESQQPRGYLDSLGIKAFLKDLIEAPEPIMRYLCANHNFHKIPLAAQGDANQYKVLSERYRKFYIGSQFYNVTTSRYDGQQVVGSEKVREAQLLQYSLDKVRLRECESEYNELHKEHTKTLARREELSAEDDKFRQEWQKLADRHREFSIKEDEKRRIQTILQRAHESLVRLNSEKIDIEAERETLAKSIKTINASTVSTILKLVANHEIHIAMRREHMKDVIKFKLAVLNYKISKQKLSKTQQDCVRLAEELKKAQARLRTFTAAKNEYKEAAEHLIPGFRDGELDRKTQEKFNKIVENTVPQLKDKRDDLQVRISRIYHDANNTILNEYTRQNAQLKDKTAQIAQLTDSIKALDIEQQEIKRNWVPKLQEVIEVIDRNYRDFMRKLSYDGQVKLDYNLAEPDNFSAYGIMILVKYRDNDNLIPLSATRQSGGERSVATMIYMLALQTKTTVPFRCVDEINQGMDKDNERKVFELLIHTADSSSSQYFLVSPKLLNNLPYSDKMMVHVVYNGMNLQKSIWNRKC